MPVKICQTCGHGLSPTAKFCPECGASVKNGQKQKTASAGKNHVIIIAVLGVAAAIYLGSLLVGEEDQIAQAPHDFSNIPLTTELATYRDNLPDSFEPLVQMGNSLMDQGQFHLALECYSKALQIDSIDVNVRVDLGTCQHSIGNNQAAIAQFKKALEFQSDHQTAKFNLGIVYYSMADTANAIEWWSRLLEEDPPPELRSRAEELMMQLLQE
ncbi:MAG: tetratricopeptide repeat protein [candidate division Zixibacteria bacterium]